ncbi:MAG: hypothetical protein L6Q73_21290, partial [Aquabacterium sp.]|nr:hypothetical protein [Aquabacterium sp.]
MLRAAALRGPASTLRGSRSRLHGVGKGRRKEQCLALARKGRKQDRQVFGKTEVEHAVGFVEHQQAQFAKPHRALGEQVDQPPRRRHQHIDALRQPALLRVEADPAVSGVATQVQAGAIGLQAGQHLFGEFA